MKTGFKNPIAPKEKKSSDRPWSYKAPDYDQRSSHGVSAGDNYGVGFNQPIGSETITQSYAVPTGKVQTLKIYE